MSILGVSSVLLDVYQFGKRTQRTVPNEAGFTEQLQNIFDKCCEGQYSAACGKVIDLTSLQAGGAMAKKIRKNYNVVLDVGGTDNAQTLIPTGMLTDHYDIRCTNYVRISPKTLSNMERNPALKRRVMNAIKEFSSQEEQAEIRALHPPVKSAGMMIYPEGKTLYWLESYPNELGNEKGRSIIGKESINDCVKGYGNMNYRITENDMQNILSFIGYGYMECYRQKGF